jgi:hypothetical protein
MIGELKVRIEEYYRHGKDSNPLFRKASTGELHPIELQQYLRSTHYLVHHTPVHLKRAEEISRERKHVLLAEFFASKRREEDGHDRWAQSDLNHLEKKFHPIQPRHVAKAILKLIQYNASNIEKDPALYLPYILLAEYFTVLMGPSWLKDLESNCGFTREMISVVGNHIELDKEHILHDIDALATLVDAEHYRQPFLEVLEECLRFYDAFAFEIAGR